MNNEPEMTEERAAQLRAEDRELDIALNKELMKAPVTYEWQLIVKVDILMRIVGVVVSLLFGGIIIYGGVSKETSWAIYAGVIIGILFLGMTRYLWFADKDVHYKLTPLGIIYTEAECIPDVAYTVVRIFSWISVALCLAAVVFVGPLAFVGAGGMALMAFKFTGFNSSVKTNTIHFSGDYKVKVVSNGGVMSLFNMDENYFYYGRIHFQPSKEEELIKQLSEYINIIEESSVSGITKLD